MTSLSRARKGTIDWAFVRRQMASAIETSQALLETPRLAPKLSEASLAALAQARTTREEDEQLTAIVSFELAGRSLAIETRHVCEIVAMRHVAPVPQTPAHFVGIHDLHGQLLPVVDLRAVIGLPAHTPPVFSWALACGTGEPECLLLADAILDVGNALLDEGPPASRDQYNGLLLARTAEGMPVLDGSAILSDPRLTLDDEAAAGSGEEDIAS